VPVRALFDDFLADYRGVSREHARAVIRTAQEAS
jgi:uncharacterized protein (DUF433 family)